MDSETVKRLILEKLFNEFIPKLIGYYKLLSPEVNYWRPSFFILQGNAGDLSQEEYEVNLNVTTNVDRTFERCTIYRRRKMSYQQIMLGEFNNVPENVLDLNFNNKNTAINELCKILDNSYVLKLGMCALQEIENHELPGNCSVGDIKKILGFNPNIDLNNLETRKVLLEKTK